MGPLNATYISTATTTTVKSGIGRMARINITETAAGTITIYDNTAASGAVLFSFDSTNALNTYTFDVQFATGLTVITSAATKVTVSSR